MRKKVSIKTTRTEIFCDDCGEKINWDLQCSVPRCEYCGKDLCEKCIEYEAPTTGDYREVYCKSCWEIAKPYRKKMANLEDEIDTLYDECKIKCRSQRKLEVIRKISQ
ncbi:MAG: hypothetical protein U9R54_06345 [Bacteroidota bacterium]|nr:hypothetical protein [Bacteroidota bacterium]